MNKRLRLFLTLATASIAFVVAGSILNWAVNDQGEGIRQQIYIRGDVGLFLVVPVFLISLFPAVRGDYRAILVILGLLSYPIYVMYREMAFADKHLFILFFIASASCAFYGIVTGAAIVRKKAPAIRERRDWLAGGIVFYSVYFLFLYISGYIIGAGSIIYPTVERDSELGHLVYSYAFLHLYTSYFFIAAGILFPFIIYAVVLVLKKRGHGFILALVVIISSLMLPLSVSTYRDFDSLIRLIVISSCTLFSTILTISLLRVLPKGDTGQRNGHGTKY